MHVKQSLNKVSKLSTLSMGPLRTDEGSAFTETDNCHHLKLQGQMKLSNNS